VSDKTAVDIMSNQAYRSVMNGEDKPLVWLEGEIKTPPFTATAQIEAGTLLRRLQRGEYIGIPHSRPMPSIGPSCHELRIRDAD